MSLKSINQILVGGRIELGDVTLIAKKLVKSPL